MFPDSLLEQSYESYIAPNVSGPFQTVFRCDRVGEIHAFWRYLKYVITLSHQPAFADVGGEEEPRDNNCVVSVKIGLLKTGTKVTNYY